MARTTIPAELVAINAIQGTLIADNAITAVHIATNAVSGTLVADNAITSTHIAQNNVTATQIAMNTITVTQLADSAVETAKLNNDAVTQAKIADDAVGADQLAANSVVSASIVNGSIVAADLADNAVTLAKMASLARGKIIYGDSAGDPAALALGTAGTIITSDGTDISWSNTISGSPTDNLLKVNQTGSGGSHHGFQVDTASTSAWAFRAAVGGTTKLGVSGSNVYVAENLGVGVASPAFTNGSGLEIQRDGIATLRIEDTGSSGKPLEIFADDATGYHIKGLGSGMYMTFGTVNAERMRIDTTGRVLMGTHQTNGTSAEYGQAQITCAPAAADSHVSGLGIGFQGNVAEGGSTGLDFFTKVSLSGAKWNHASIRALTHGVTASAYGSLQFYTMHATTMTEKMRIVSDGTVRIYQGGYGRPFALGSNWGYSTGYRAIVMGSASTTYTTNHTGSVTLSFNYNPSGNGSGAFSGNGNEIIFRRSQSFYTPNSADNGWHNQFTMTDGVSSGDFNDTSDKNLKENISTISNGLNIISKLNPVTFDWKDSFKGNGLGGFIAQEVKTILPNDVVGEEYKEGERGEPLNAGLSINTTSIVAHLVKAVQELKAENDSLKARVTTLEG